MRRDSEKAPDSMRTLIILCLAVFLAIMVGWLLAVGKDILLPIVIAVLSAYVMSNASRALGRWPVTGCCLRWCDACCCWWDSSG